MHRGEVLVLNFHRVSPHHNPYWPPLAPEVFAALVEHLDRTCEVVTFAQLATGRRREGPRVVLSFDDGCRDFVDYVMPILERYSVQANQNVIVESVDTGRPPWINAVMDALSAASTSRVRSLSVPGFPYRLDDDDDPAKVKYGTLLANYLKQSPPSEREYVCGDVVRLLDDTNADKFTPMMSLRETTLVGDFHELGCHSYSHESMEHVSEADFRRDIDRCAGFFASVGHPMNIYAFPNGSYRDEQIEILLAQGIEHVLLVDERPSTVTRGVHPRITMYGDSAAELRLRAMGWRPQVGLSLLNG